MVGWMGVRLRRRRLMGGTSQFHSLAVVLVEKRCGGLVAQIVVLNDCGGWVGLGSRRQRIWIPELDLEGFDL